MDRNRKLLALCFGGRAIMYFATPANPTVSGDGGAGAAGGGGGAPPAPAAPASGTGTPPAAPGTGAAPATPPVDGMKQLRGEYDGLKTKYEPYEKLGATPEQLGMSHAVYTRMFQDAASIGRALGYPDAEIIEALKEDPIATIDYLRNEQFEKGQGRTREGKGGEDEPDLNELISQRVQETIGPIQERENLRMVNEANNLFARTVQTEFAALMQKEGLDISKVSPDESQLVVNAVSELMKYDEQAVRALKFEGKTAGVQKYFHEAINMIDKYFIARSTRERSMAGGGQRPPGGGPPPPAGQGKKPSLEDMINDPNSIRRAGGRPDFAT